MNSKFNTINTTMIFFIGAILGIAGTLLVTGCGVIQPSPNDHPSQSPQVTVQDIEAACTAACTANETFEFTQCGSELMRALPVGEMVSTLGDCAVRCHEFVEVFNTMPDSLDINCLVAAKSCADVAACLGVE